MVRKIQDAAADDEKQLQATRFYKTYEEDLKRAYDLQNSQNSRQLGISALAAVIFDTIAAFFQFILLVMAAAAASGTVMGILLVGYLVFSQVRVKFEGLYSALASGDYDYVNSFIVKINEAVQVSNFTVTLLNLGVITLDLTIGFFIMFLVLFFDVGVQILIDIFMLFGDLFIQFMLQLAQFAIIVLQCFASIVSGVVTGDSQFGGTVGAGDQTWVVVGNALKFLAQIIMRAFVAFYATCGPVAAYVIQFFMNIVFRFAATIIPTVMWIVQMLNPGNALHSLLFIIADLIYGFDYIAYNECMAAISGIKMVCGYVSTIVGAINQVLNVLNSVTGSSLKISLSCNLGQITSVCPPPPANLVASILGGSGAGLCNAEQCTADVLGVLPLLQSALPFCTNWVASGNVTIACMSIVYAFATANTTALTAAPFASIAQEMCFVTTATVINQCTLTQGNDPFGFSWPYLADQVCVADKSGLVPPELPFNEGCACVYSAPLCLPECCNQYSLHVIGQVQSYIGAQTCGSLLAEYPYDFWCQFADLTPAQMPPYSDLMFSSDWCAAYTLVVQPACASTSPAMQFNSIALGPFVANFTATFCNSTVGQPGICVPTNVGTDPGIIALQYAQSTTTLESVISSALGNAATFMNGQPVDVTPLATDTPLQILQKDIQQYYCFYFAALFNNSSPILRARQKSVLATTSAFCNTALGQAYASFDFTSQIFYQTRNAAGEIVQPPMIGIPAGVLTFGAQQDNPAVPTPNSITNGNTTGGLTGTNIQCQQTGISAAEVNDAHACAALSAQQTFNGSTTMGNTGVTANNQLSQNAVTMQPAAHLSGLEPISPNSPNYQQQTQDRNEVVNATAVSTAWSATPVADLKPETRNYRSTSTAGKYATNTYLFGPNPFAGSQRNDDSTSSTTRTLQSVDPASDSPTTDDLEQAEQGAGPIEAITSFTHLASAVGVAIEEAKRVAAHELARLIAEATIVDPHSSRVERLFTPERAARGKRRLLHVLETAQRESAEVLLARATGRQTFAVTRRLMGLGGNATGSTLLERARTAMGAFWDAVAEQQVAAAAVDSSTVLSAKQQKAAADTEYLFRHAALVWAPSLLQYYYHTNYSGVEANDYAVLSQEMLNLGGGLTVPATSASFGATAGSGNGTCYNTWAEPLRCCTYITSPYDCCRGLEPFCIPPITTFFYWPPATLQNIDEYRCPAQQQVYGWWKSLIQLSFTLFLMVTNYVLPVGPIWDKIFGWLQYPGGAIPPLTFQCLVIFSDSFFLSLLIVWAIALFVATGWVADIVLLTTTRAEIVEAVEQLNALRANVHRISRYITPPNNVHVSAYMLRPQRKATQPKRKKSKAKAKNQLPPPPPSSQF